MQHYDVIKGVIQARAEQVPYGVCQDRFGIGAGTITRIIRFSKDLGLTAADLETMDPAAVEEAFYPVESRRHKYDPPNFERIEKVLMDRGGKISFAAGWFFYCEMCGEGADHYGYSQFVKLFRDYLETRHGPTHVKMIIERQPGERGFLDWIGDQPQVLLNPETGEITKAHIFCVTIGVSSLIYAQVFPDETLANFIEGIVNALKAYGAVPKYLVPDNLKTAVTEHTKDKLILTSACRDLQDFYDVIFLPPPYRKPRGKGSVENAVKHLETYLVGPLLEKGPLTLDDANELCSHIVENLNTRHERNRKSTRQEVFEAVDRPHMRALPDGTFTLWEYDAVKKVPQDYHLRFDKHLYSVPYRMVGKPAILRASVKEIIIVDESNQLLARHRRIHNPSPLKSTDPEHYHPSHRFAAEVNEMDGDRYRDWAKRIGPMTETVIARILASASREEQMYASCHSIIWHVQEQQIDLPSVEAAAKFCLENDLCSCSQFTKRITEEANRKARSNARSNTPTHINTRGKDYYK